ncbi:MAG: Na/Pi cotransporter family protein [Clostridia bacterium]|nr:Na/Pi cotransporter family protein [Clostridia bacterium]
MVILSTVLGGIGLFILGMLLMTEGLKALAGNSLKTYLSKFTGGYFSAITTGAVITGIIQSSSAATLMTIGFASAGFLTFTQALGVVLGINLGGTGTSWILAALGLKLNLSLITFPLIGVGVFLRILSRKYSAHGTALIGFSLLFLGIDTLQQGMSGVAEIIDFAAFAQDNFLNRFILLFIGIIMTIIMQSSSAAVAVTLAALDASTISFIQAAVLVIGQNVGTTFKAGLATIGGSVLAKRTALGHILFNVITALGAFITLPVFIWLIDSINKLFNITDPTIELALFHTVFNVLGLIIILAFVNPFSALIFRLIPEQEEKIGKNLDVSVAEVVPVAIEATRKTLLAILNALLEYRHVLATKQIKPDFHEKISQVSESIQEVRYFLSKITTDKSQPETHENHLSIIHATNHLERLVKNINNTRFLETISNDANLSDLSTKLFSLMDILVNQKDLSSLVEIMETESYNFAEERKINRETIIEEIAQSRITPDEGLNKIDAYIWLDRLAYHLWRITVHLSGQKYPEHSEEYTLDEAMNSMEQIN